MAKIRVQELARMMGLAEQDLVFKLRSLGVRIEGDEGVDSEALSAILQGKKLASPREVIMDDTPPAPVKRTGAAPAAAGAAPGGAAAARRATPNPLKSARRRTIIQSVEPRILTLPPSQPERAAEHEAHAPMAAAPAPMAPAAAPAPAPVAPAPPPAEPRPTAPAAPASAAPTAAAPPLLAGATPAAPAAPAPPRRGAILIHRPTEPYRPPAPSSRPGGPGRGPGGGYSRPGGPGGRPGGPGAGRPSGPGGRPGGPGGRPGGPGAGRPGGPGGFGRPGARPGGPGRPGVPPPVLPPTTSRGERRGDSVEAEKKKKAKKTSRRTLLQPQADEANLRAMRGSLEDIENVVDEAVVPTGSVRRRRRDENHDEDVHLHEDIQVSRRAEDGPIVISEGMTVREFAERVGVRVRDLIRLLFDRGIVANINHVIEPELGVKLAAQFGLEAKVMSFEEEIEARNEEAMVQAELEGQERRTSRAPVVTIMGHVDHGKTSLLDKIRSSKIAEGESGGITQHIGAYHVDVKNRQIVFLDTPGHEAFTLMRARGAKVTDVVILVVAADDGVMPQTLEAIDHARAAKVPIIVALNKIDKPNANPDRVKQQLAEKGLTPEDWGGETVVVPVSAQKGTGIDDLLEMVLLTSDLLDLKAAPDRPAQGAVLEARKETGRGVVSTVLVQNGRLRVGDIFVSGATWGRVRSMNDDRARRVDESGPATAVEVTGFQDVPEAGDTFQVVGDEQKARGIVEFRQQEQRRRDLTPSLGRVSLEALFSKIEQGEVKDLAIVLKADVQGSVEVLRDAIEKASTARVKVTVLHSGVGAISTNDVLLASASKAIIVGFNIRPERNAAELAEKEGVEIRLHTVIYELLDELKLAMTGLLEPTFREVARGRAEIREIFKVPKIGTIAGAHVVDGVIPRSAGVRLVRDGKVVYEGKISSLKRFKDDASEVRAGFDCGIGLERFQDMKPGDVIEAFVKEEVAPTLV
jgi:translation initiation factor IF-2